MTCPKCGAPTRRVDLSFDHDWHGGETYTYRRVVCTNEEECDWLEPDESDRID